MVSDNCLVAPKSANFTCPLFESKMFAPFRENATKKVLNEVRAYSSRVHLQRCTRLEHELVAEYLYVQTHLNIPMKFSILRKKFQSFQDFRNNERYLVLLEGALRLYFIMSRTSVYEFHYNPQFATKILGTEVLCKLIAAVPS